ncbi:unnamed protein product [Clonostachys rosea]|uniref:Uncharacterized protein n=1 Tax=Bionectria ochroleuca TaxID=29856 RepID=A0ABY6UG42_BIOOC|nr:unnamed protein product [Clonostachys rosea]
MIDGISVSHSSSIGQLWLAWGNEKEEVIRGPFNYSTSQPGKGFRSQLLHALNQCLLVPQESFNIISRAVEILHEASLLIDDIQDESKLRRGQPAAYRIFGTGQTINSANYAYFLAFQEIMKLNNPSVVPIFLEELLSLHQGQGIELHWKDSLKCPSEIEYFQMASKKTGGLFRIGTRLMQAESSLCLDMVPFVNLLGILFQIRDDYSNLKSAEYAATKGPCEDLTEGKFSFPILHSIHKYPHNSELYHIIRQRTTDEQTMTYTVEYLERTGSFEYTRQMMGVLVRKAKEEIARLGLEPEQTKDLARILEKVTL